MPKEPEPRKGNRKRVSSITRVLELIKRFNDDNYLCIEGLLSDAYWEELSERTIRRDLSLINEVYPNFFHHIDGSDGCYKAITNEMFNNIVTPAKMALIVQTFNIGARNQLYKNLKIPIEEVNIIDKLIKKSEEHYLFKNKPFENQLANIEQFQKLEHCISYRKVIKIIFPLARGEDIEITIKPYKILFMNENFYLACERTDVKYQFSRYRISRIKEIVETGATFKRSPDIEDFIKSIQTPFAKYVVPFRKSLFDVELEIDASIIRYFYQKKYLLSQRETILKNGNLKVTYTVTDEREVESIIKRWLPLVRVITPQSLKDKIHKDLQTYLQK